MTDSNRPSRRTVLRLSGTALTTTLLAGCMGNNDGESGTTTGETATTTNGETTTGNETTGNETTTTTSGGSNGDSNRIRLGAKKSGWVGRKPQSIAGKKNPTLSLTAGQKYTLTWKNLDGMEHELLIVDGSDKKLVKSDDAAKKGETVSVTFTASKKMTTYYCEYHPQSMRGKVKIEGEQG